MSQKNHVKVDGRLLQTNKKYSQLKLKQKERISQWMYQETKNYCQKYQTFPEDKHLDQIVGGVYERIEAAGIWIPYGEVRKHYKKVRRKLFSRYRNEVRGKPHHIQKACFMNMCMILDSQGNVLALDKENGRYTGTTFPGGHVEPGETFQDSVIREVREETGLEIQEPALCGVYHWKELNFHNVLFLYKAEKFTGTLKSSKEGKVYWIPVEEFEKKELAKGMEYVLEIMKGERMGEYFMHMQEDEYTGGIL